MAEDQKKDRLHVGPDLGSGHIYVRERANGETSIGLASTDPSRLPTTSSVATIKHVEDNVYEVHDETVCNAPGSKGPAKVNSREYRDNWDGIFGKKSAVGQA
jgi:hypothetical protein